eukprot:12886133-Prorocentrum_lima.AAC.1
MRMPTAAPSELWWQRRMPSVRKARSSSRAPARLFAFPVVPSRLGTRCGQDRGTQGSPLRVRAPTKR